VIIILKVDVYMYSYFDSINTAKYSFDLYITCF